MKFSYRLYVDFRFFFELITESIRNSFRWTPLGPKRFKNWPKSLNGNVAVITGSNTGIGKVNATQLAKLGAKVIMACRDMAKAHIAAEDIKKQTKNANIVVMKLDLTSLASVRQFATQVNEQESHIDLLINNAGLMFCPNWKTEDGFDIQFGTNHLGHFLLTLMLMDKLKKSTNARIINVSSVAHIRGEINFEDINFEKSYDKYDAYSQSKLANVLFTRELANKLSDTNVRVYSLHPGLINTDLYRHFGGFFGTITRIQNKVIQMDPELGAQTTIYCALEESLNNESGFYYKNCSRVDNMVPNAVDDVCARRLWELSCDLVNIEDKYSL